jgi:hypothetical protein
MASGTRSWLAVLVFTVLSSALAACGGDGGGRDGTTLPDVADTDPGPGPELPDVPDVPGDRGPGDVPDATDEGDGFDADDSCLHACDGKECGTNPCGGTCGTCPAGCDGVTPRECVDGACQVPCCPDCEGRECGDDGCGGTCGSGCTSLAACDGGTLCDALSGRCVDACCWATDRPTTWGPAAVVSALQTPADAAVVKATCFDYTGEGDGDNGLKGLAGQVNGPLADAVSGGSIAILFELAGVTDFANTPSFQLNGLMGQSTETPAATRGDFYVSEDSYVAETCMPMISFRGAGITAGALAAGPSEFRLSIPIQADLVIDATLIQAQIKGTVANADAADGYEIAGGVLSGVLTKAQLEAALAKLQAACDAAPADAKPSYCSYLTVAKSAMALLFDLHDNGDGTFRLKTKDLPGDAASVCLAFTMSKAKVVGFVPTVP